MLNSSDIKLAYNELYKVMRNYIWDYNTVVDLANLEVESYTTFPDVDNLKRLYNILFQDILSMYHEDEELRDAFDEYSETLDNSIDGVYTKLSKVNEVIPNEDIKDER